MTDIDRQRAKERTTELWLIRERRKLTPGEKQEFLDLATLLFKANAAEVRSERARRHVLDLSAVASREVH